MLVLPTTEADTADDCYSVQPQLHKTFFWWQCILMGISFFILLSEPLHHKQSYHSPSLKHFLFAAMQEQEF